MHRSDFSLTICSTFLTCFRRFLDFFWIVFAFFFFGCFEWLTFVDLFCDTFYFSRFLCVVFKYIVSTFFFYFFGLTFYFLRAVVYVWLFFLRLFFIFALIKDSGLTIWNIFIRLHVKFWNHVSSYVDSIWFPFELLLVLFACQFNVLLLPVDFLWISIVNFVKTPYLIASLRKSIPPRR